MESSTGKRSTAAASSSRLATAVTDANGVAATSLKLNQKNGTYTASATFTPAGANNADAPYYIGSSQGVVFKLQAK